MFNRKKFHGNCWLNPFGRSSHCHSRRIHFLTEIAEPKELIRIEICKKVSFLCNKELNKDSEVPKVYFTICLNVQTHAMMQESHCAQKGKNEMVVRTQIFT
jgi:hypothetical protein